MKSLNENIGLSGGAGMSHFDGKFDVNADSEVVRIKAELDQKAKDLIEWQQKYNNAVANMAKYGTTRAQHLANVGGNTSDPNFIQAMHWLDLGQQRDGGIKSESEVYITSLKEDVIALTAQLAVAKTAAIEANNKIIDTEIKLLAEKAKTDPEALKQVTALNEQKLAGEQALAKQKSSSSNTKTFVIAGVVILALGAIAGLWIWLKSRKAV